MRSGGVKKFGRCFNGMSRHRVRKKTSKQAAQRSAARHSTAQHSTAQHSTAHTVYRSGAGTPPNLESSEEKTQIHNIFDRGDCLGWW